MTPMAREILTLVRSEGEATFAQLESRIAGFGGGDLRLRFPGRDDLVLWVGLSEAAVAALQELKDLRLIHPLPVSMTFYLFDGGPMPDYPVTRDWRRKTKTPRWVPVAFYPGDHR